MSQTDIHRGPMSAYQRAVAAPAAALFAVGMLVAVLELILHAFWHPGRAPLALDGRGWLRASALTILLYGAAGLVFGLLYSACWGRILERRGRRALEDARRGAVWLGAWLCFALEAIWWTRFATLSGASFFSPQRLFEACWIGMAAAVPAFLVAAYAARQGALWSQWSLGISSALLVLSAILPPAAPSRSNPETVLDSSGAPIVPPSIVLIVVDALRAESLTDMPRAMAIAAQGASFERAFTTAPSTWPSLASLFTGRYPSEHGILRMSPEQRLEGLDGTLAAHLERRGYHATALVSGALANGSGLLNGFRELFELSTGRGRFRLDDPWSVLRAELTPLRVVEKLRSKFDAERVATEAVRFLEHAPQRPFFLYVHLYATHVPYEPPAAYCLQHSECGDRTRFSAEEARAIEAGDWLPNEAEWRSIRALYRASVAWADAQIGRIDDALQRSGRGADTVFVITADHGEELGDHHVDGVPCVEHDWMWNTNLQVPLVLRGRGIPAGTSIQGARSLTALKPSLERLSQHAPLWAAPLLGPDVQETFASSENSVYRAVQNAQWKLLRERRGGREWWFDLVNDPTEREGREIPPPDAPLVQRMRDALATLEAQEARFEAARTLPAAPSSADPAVLEALRAAGYLGGSRPREMMPRRLR